MGTRTPLKPEHQTWAPLPPHSEHSPDGGTQHLLDTYHSLPCPHIRGPFLGLQDGVTCFTLSKSPSLSAIGMEKENRFPQHNSHTRREQMGIKVSGDPHHPQTKMLSCLGNNYCRYSPESAKKHVLCIFPIKSSNPIIA